MGSETILEKIKELLFDPGKLAQYERLALLQDLYERATRYMYALRAYENQFDMLVEKGLITPFPEDWQYGEIGKLYVDASRLERIMFEALQGIYRHDIREVQKRESEKEDEQ